MDIRDKADLTSALRAELSPVFKGGYSLDHRSGLIARVLRRNGYSVKCNDRTGKIEVNRA